MKKPSQFLFKISVGLMALTSAAHGAECFPDNDLKFPVHSKQKSLEALSGINEFQANQIIENFKRVTSGDIQRQLGKKLIINLDWENPRVNASATSDDNDNPVIILYGGMVRHPDLSADGLYTILCHELGHHLGGAPKKFRGYSQKRSWSSAEGQADYYAAAKCLPFIFRQPISSPKMENLVGTKQLSAAEISCGNDLICSRILLAGYSVAKVFASLRDYMDEPSLSAHDKELVWETNMGHPRPQCRLDTIRSGALCSVSPSLPFDGIDPSIGACFSYKSDDVEGEIGARPRCWFYPESN